MNRLFGWFRNLFFFLTGFASGVTFVFGSIYIFILHEEANKNRRRYSGYSGYFARRGTPRAEQGSEGEEPQT